MRMRMPAFEVDRNEKKLFGVCAGIARSTGIDATIVRIAVVLMALIGSFWFTCVAYGVAAIVGQRQRGGHRDDLAPARVADNDEARERMRSLDLRMQAIEAYTASSNSRLAREIEELR